MTDQSKTANTGPRERLSMDTNWKFHLGQIARAEAIDHGSTYGSVKAGQAGGPAGTRFDDGNWRTLDVPHDWMVEQPFDPSANVSHGFHKGGVAWYRKHFDIPASDLGRRMTFEFDGVFRNCTVWLNGHRLGNHPSGYTSFWFDVTDIINYGGENVLAVFVDATEFEGWWYEGAGIYRHVWLTKTAPVHIAHWGVFVSAEVEMDGEQALAAEVTIQTTIDNESDDAAGVQVRSMVLDASGEVVGSAVSDYPLPAGELIELEQSAEIDAPVLWTVDSPYLYSLRTDVLVDGEVVDTCTTPFGIRSIWFDSEEGFFLNGKPLKLQGTCNHQDHAGVGVALPDRLQEFRVERLKQMGCNAYRTAHNPPTAELLDACDRLGMLVMAENRHLSSSPDGLADLESMILRDRNHPSVIMWSMANEEPLQSTDVGTRIVTTLNNITRALDPTRPTTTAMNGGWGEGFSLAHDVQGCNYSIDGYDPYHEKHPEHPLAGSETASALGTRGEYVTDAAKGFLSAYDVNWPDWGASAEAAWTAIADRPFMAGTFVWTGFDYRGEPQPYEWPCIHSAFGIMDTCGFAKDSFYYYKSWWTEETVLHILPHWNWPGREGESIDVWCYSNCDTVELSLNGTSLGEKPMPRNGHLEWSVPYEPGTLTARGVKDGVETTATVETTGPAEQIKLAADREQILAGGRDVAVVTVSVHDAEGRLMPIADDLVSFECENGVVIGVGNGNPSSHEPDKATMRRVFNGLCQVIIQSPCEAGTVKLSASAPGLTAATLAINAG